MRETKNAESTLYLVAKYFGKFDDPQKMNLAMRILNMAMMIQARDGIVCRVSFPVSPVRQTASRREEEDA